MHVKSVEAHHTWALISSCKVMQRKCIDHKNEIRGLLKIFGVKLPLRLSRDAFDEAVRDTIQSDPALSYALLPMLEARGVLMRTCLELDRRVKKVAREDALCRRFMGIPGVGEITALSFKAAVDNPARFKNSRISHAGNSNVRATL